SLTFHDLGVSAFKGANVETGRLGDFLEAVRHGLVQQGSYLLVEALDRLSRLTPRRALNVLTDIVDAGVTVVTLNDNKAYSAGSLDGQPFDLMVALLLFMRGNEESATKSRRLRAAWEGKRLTAATKPLTSAVPAWIRLEGEGAARRLVLIPERAAIIRRIYAGALAGRGQEAIAKGLIADGVPCFGKAKHWQRSYVLKVLCNRATYGLFTPHEYRYEGARKTRVPLDSVEGYYPAAILRETYDAVQDIRSTAHAAKPRAGQIANLFAGLATCPLCASTMTRVNKGSGPKGGRPKLVCVKAKAGAGCQYHGVDLGIAEDGFLSDVGEFIGNAPSGVAGLDEELDRLDVVASVLHEQIENIVQSLAEVESSEALIAKLRELEHELAVVRQDRGDVLDKLATGSSPVLAQRLRDIQTALQAQPLDRPRASALLRRVLRSVVIDYPNGRLTFEWKHGGESSVQYAWPTAVAS
nr:recombinase family protein [Methylibium sp.]